MHLPDGIISAPAIIGGYAAAAGITALSMYKIKKQHINPRNVIPRAALLTAAFFAASLIHIPIPPSSVHLVLSGLMGVMLGWFSFPVILVGLLLQAVMLQHGGLTTLGINACLMGVPALLAYYIFFIRKKFRQKKLLPHALLAFAASFIAIVLGALMAALLIVFATPAYLDATAERHAVIALSLAHLPVAILEGVFTAIVVLFLLKVKPALLESDGQ